ncbi:MAG: hypothetical protein C0411_16285 [Pseudomonas sp.]|nr:hypothetical protein [Pseudomonas sp.]
MPEGWGKKEPGASDDCQSIQILTVARELAPARARSVRKIFDNCRDFGAASQPSGSKLPRHKSLQRRNTGGVTRPRGSSWVPAQSVERFTPVRSPKPRPDHHQCTRWRGLSWRRA